MRMGPPECDQDADRIRVTHDGKTTEFASCFECFQVHAAIKGEQGQTFLISRSPAVVFNEVLKKADVPLAKSPGEK